MATEHVLLVTGKLVVLGLGLAIAALAFVGHRRTGSPLMLLLATAFGLIALGSFVEGLLFEVLGWPLLTVHLVESAFVLAGLAALAVLLRPGGSSS